MPNVSMAHLLPLMNQYQQTINYSPYSIQISLVLCLIVLFCSRTPNQDSALHLIVMSL